jgi:hypothetical protein
MKKDPDPDGFSRTGSRLEGFGQDGAKPSEAWIPDLDEVGFGRS